VIIVAVEICDNVRVKREEKRENMRVYVVWYYDLHPWDKNQKGLHFLIHLSLKIHYNGIHIYIGDYTQKSMII
jgi:hypothetical protein